MACACKQAKILEKKYGATNNKNERGGKYYIIKMGSTLTYILLNRIVMPLILFAICLFVFPVILVMLILTQLIGGRAKVIVPHEFMDKFKEAYKKYKENKITMSKIDVSGK